MEAKNLKEGQYYYYNGDSGLVKVRYNGHTKEGYSFTEKGRKGTTACLTAKEVNALIES
ncbi:hypothetical protein FACS1894169_00840 [Bacteroidia bacterium]|nr:hypothetical protein FACS1894169_00840 [Bacteroidia bacterium]